MYNHTLRQRLSSEMTLSEIWRAPTSHSCRSSFPELSVILCVCVFWK